MSNEEDQVSVTSSQEEVESNSSEEESNYPLIQQAIGEIYESGMTSKQIREALVERILYYENIQKQMGEDDFMQGLKDGADSIEEDFPKEERSICMQMELSKKKPIIMKEIQNYLDRHGEGEDEEESDNNKEEGDDEEESDDNKAQEPMHSGFRSKYLT